MKDKTLFAILTVLLVVGSIVSAGFTVVQGDYSSFVVIVPMEHGYIRSDGTIEPATLPIERTDNFYFLKDNIVNYTIEIQSNNIVFDGNGYTLALPQESYTTNPGKYGPALIQINNCSNIVVQNTTFSTYYQGVSATNSSRITILGNNFANGRGSIILRSCSDCEVLGNNLTDNSSSGLSALDSTYLNIAYNNISRNQNGGCLLQAVTYSNITRNNIIDNSLGYLNGKGIYIILASNNSFVENNFVNNPTAILFAGDHGCFNNSIYRNYFHDNHLDILNTGGDAVSGTNESPLGSPASTNFELQLYASPQQNSTNTDSNNNPDFQTVAILAGLAIIVTLLAAIFLHLKNRDLRKNGERRGGQRFVFMGVLFLWLKLGIAFRRLSIGYSLFLWLGRIFSQKLGVRACLPSRTETWGKRLCIRRLRCIRPSQRQRWFRVCPVSRVVLRVPRLCVRCVRLQLFGSSENQGLSAKTFTTSIAGKTGNIRFSTPLYYRVKLRDIASY
jgi:parallel beta-helix repeat protein